MPSFFPGKSGFDWYPCLERSGTGVPVVERSDAEGGGACGTTLVSPRRRRGHAAAFTSQQRRSKRSGDLSDERCHPGRSPFHRARRRRGRWARDSRGQRRWEALLSPHRPRLWSGRPITEPAARSHHQHGIQHSAREASRHSALGTEQATELVADPVAELASEHATELVQDPPRGRCHSVIPDRRLSHGRGPSRHVFVNCLRSFTLIDAPVH